MDADRLAKTRISDGELIADSAYLALASILSTGLNLAVGLIMVRILVPEQYGMVAFFLRLLALVRFLGTLGLGVKIVEDVSRYLTLGDRQGLRQAVCTLGLVRLLIGVGLVLVLVFLMWLRSDSTFAWAGLAGFWAALFDLAAAIVQGLKRRKALGWLSVTQPFLFLVGVLCLAITHKVASVPIYVLTTISYLLAFLACTLVLKNTSILAPGRGTVSWSYLCRTIRPLLSLFAFGVLNHLYLSWGTLALGQAKLFEDAAYLNASFMFVTLPSVLGLMVVSAVFYTDLVTALTHGETKAATRLIDTSLRGTLLVLAVPMGVLMVYADFVVRLFYTDRYAASILPLTTMAPMAMVLVLQQILSFGLFAVQRVNLASKGMGLQAVLAGCGTWAAVLWAGEHRLCAIAVAYVVSALLGTLMQWKSLKRYLPFTTSLWHLVSIMSITGLVMTLGRQIGGWLLGEFESGVFAFGVVMVGSLCLWVIMRVLYDHRERSSLSASFSSVLVAWWKRL